VRAACRFDGCSVMPLAALGSSVQVVSGARIAAENFQK
jgi:hypothetical protein